MDELTHTFPAQTCPEAWVKAAEYLFNQPNREAYYLILAIAEPERMTPADLLINDLVDDFLRSHDEDPVVTVAGTIFPANHYLREGAKGVFETFPKISHKLVSLPWGSYSMRMLRKNGKGQIINPLEILIGKLKKQMQRRGRMRNVYEINVAHEEEDEQSCELPIYAAESDRNLIRAQPCLSHLSFKLYPGNQLTLSVMYRSHYYISKAFGNLLGLAQLQSFVATEAGLSVGPLVCFSTHARIDPGISVRAVRRLISKCKETL